MKKLIFILMVGCVFAIGERKESITYTISEIKSFSDITGWIKLTNGKWRSGKNKIPRWNENTDQDETWASWGLGYYNIMSISYFEIKEQPDKLILLFRIRYGYWSYPTILHDWHSGVQAKYVMLINKSDLINSLQYQEHKVSTISIPVQFDDMNMSNENLNNWLYEKTYKSGTLHLHYYYSNETNTIQYLFSLIEPVKYASHLRNIIGRNRHESNFQKESIKSEMEERYFESPFDKFSQFFGIKN